MSLVLFAEDNRSIDPRRATTRPGSTRPLDRHAVVGGADMAGGESARLRPRTRRRAHRGSKRRAQETEGEDRRRRRRRRFCDGYSPSELAYLRWLRSVGVRLSGVTIGHFRAPAGAASRRETCTSGTWWWRYPRMPSSPRTHPSPPTRCAPSWRRQAAPAAGSRGAGARGDGRDGARRCVPSERLPGRAAFCATHSPLGWTASELAELEGTCAGASPRTKTASSLA